MEFKIQNLLWGARAANRVEVSSRRTCSVSYFEESTEFNDETSLPA